MLLSLPADYERLIPPDDFRRNALAIDDGGDLPGDRQAAIAIKTVPDVEGPNERADIAAVAGVLDMAGVDAL